MGFFLIGYQQELRVRGYPVGAPEHEMSITFFGNTHWNNKNKLFLFEIPWNNVEIMRCGGLFWGLGGFRDPSVAFLRVGTPKSKQT